MNKAELIEALVKETEMSKAGATRALNAVIDTIVKTVAKKQDVQLIGFSPSRLPSALPALARTPALVRSSKLQRPPCPSSAQVQPSKLP